MLNKEKLAQKEEKKVLEAKKSYVPPHYSDLIGVKCAKHAEFNKYCKFTHALTKIYSR